MFNALFEPLNAIIQNSDTLLSQDYGLLNTIQERFIESIMGVARDLQTLFASMSGLSNEAAVELLSYETRSHLASIIGYAEVLLDQTEGALTDEQNQFVQQIRANGTQLLTYVTNLLDSAT
jgi:hypothetical protein